MFLNVDILVFAGLAFMLMAIIRHLTENPVIWLIIAKLFAAVAPFLWGLGEDIPVLGYILQPFWSADTDLVILPLFPWMWFPLIGMVIGAKLKTGKNHRSTGVHVLITVVVLFLTGLILVLVDSDRFYHDYGRMGIGGVLGITGIAFLWSLRIIWLSSRLEGIFRTGFAHISQPQPEGSLCNPLAASPLAIARYTFRFIRLWMVGGYEPGCSGDFIAVGRSI